MKSSRIVYLIFINSFIFFSACRSVQKIKPIDISGVAVKSYWDNQFVSDYIEIRGRSSIIDEKK